VEDRRKRRTGRRGKSVIRDGVGREEEKEE
jgi:hypothetical protein